jgi:subtilisin family serine protease
MAAILLSCAREEIIPTEPDTSTDVSLEVADNYVSGEVRVYLSEELTAMIEEAAESGTIVTKSSDMNNALSELGITEMTRLFPHAGEYEERTRREGLHRWYVVKYSQEVPLTKAQTSLEMVEGIEIFEPVMPAKINDFNDLSEDLWGMYNRSNPGFDINVRPVWNEYTTGNPKVIVCVVDAGIDLYHEDLADNCAATGHYNFVNKNEYIIAGDHGTHVAGTIAAVGNNGKGVVGVAGGDKAKGQKGVTLISSQIFTDEESVGGGQAIKWGADNGAVISQNSWGYNFDRDGNGEIEGDEYTQAMNTRISASDKAGVDYFIKYAGCDNNGNQLPNSPMKGGVVFFAAGNDAIAMGAPAEYEKVVAVGAVSSDGRKSSFSNYGDWVDICAPGSEILSTVPGNQYEFMDGTSMACPYVSGVAALIVSYFGGQGFTNEMLWDKLIGSANKQVISQPIRWEDL